MDKVIASQAGHWYAKDGSPAYTVIGKNGRERQTTLRDARKESLVPSVTTIMRCAASPGLERWKQQNILMSALTLPRASGESLDDYSERIIDDANEQSRKAMSLGTEIHGDIEKAMAGEPHGNEETCKRVLNSLIDTFGDVPWESEKSFASPVGYGGKVDLHSKRGDGIVLDYKTKEFPPDKLPELYDDHLMQLSAYAEGLNIPMAKCGIVFVSTTHPIVHIVMMTDEQRAQGWKMFYSIMCFWQAKNKYAP